MTKYPKSERKYRKKQYKSAHAGFSKMYGSKGKKKADKATKLWYNKNFPK